MGLAVSLIYKNVHYTPDRENSGPVKASLNNSVTAFMLIDWPMYKFKYQQFPLSERRLLFNFNTQITTNSQTSHKDNNKLKFPQGYTLKD